MGHDISPIGNHNLDTSNVENLAKDIVSRIDVNIEYGFSGFKEHFKLLDKPGGDEVIILDKIIKDKKFKTFRLLDDHYILKELVKKRGEDIFSNPEYWFYTDEIPSEKIINDEKEGLIYPDYSIYFEPENEDRSGSLSINKEHYRNGMPYYSRWWTFCRFFTEKRYEDEEDLINFNKFRQELREYTLKFGGNKMYYLDDQSNILEGVGQGEEWKMTWNELDGFVKEKTAHFMLDVSTFLTDENYRNDFLKKQEYPLSFIDDFKDI